MTTNLGERNWIKAYWTQLKNWLCVASCSWWEVGKLVGEIVFNFSIYIMKWRNFKSELHSCIAAGIIVKNGFNYAIHIGKHTCLLVFFFNTGFVSYFFCRSLFLFKHWTTLELKTFILFFSFNYIYFDS